MGRTRTKPQNVKEENKIDIIVDNKPVENNEDKIPLSTATKESTEKTNIFRKINYYLSQPIWQSIGVFVALIPLIILAWNYFNRDKKLTPLSLPNGFVAYSNPDFAISFPSSVNQNNSFSFRMYWFVMDKGEEKDGQVLMIGVGEGKNNEFEDDDLFNDINSESSKNVVNSTISQSGQSLGTMKIISYEADSLQGSKGVKLVYEMSNFNEIKQEMVVQKMTMRLFWDKKNQKLYSVAYFPDPINEQIVSTLNFSKIE